MLFVRFLSTSFSEYVRQRWLKSIFLDKRETVKVFAIIRYIFISLIMVPGMTIFNKYFEFKGTMIAVISSILLFQELIVFTMIAYKIRKANPPPKINFIDRRYGPDIDREMALLKSKISSTVSLDDASKKATNETFSFK